MPQPRISGLPLAGLVQSSDGDFFGTTSYCGSVLLQ